MLRRIRDEDVKGPTKFYRPPYEGISAIAWLTGAVAYVTIARSVEAQISMVGYAAIPMLGLFGLRALQTLQNWAVKTRLTTPMPPWISEDALLEKQRRKNQTYLGKGFEWEPYHARLMKEVSTLARGELLEPPRICRTLMVWLGLAAKDVVLEGKHYIHGCGGGESDLFVSEQSRRTHTLVLGTNGAGKTRMLESLMAQAIARGWIPEEDQRRRAIVQEARHLARRAGDERALKRLEATLGSMPKLEYGPVFILDPKGDRDLRDRAYAIAKRLGRADDFHYFSPTDADVSFRVNPLTNYSRRTELANRVTALLPTGGDSEAFKQFAWRAINVVIEGLHFAGIDIHLINLRRYVEGGIEKLIIPCVERHLQIHEEFYPHWRSQTDTVRNRISAGNSLDKATATRASALAAYYVENVRSRHPNTTIDGMIEVMMHDTQHYTKLISNLIPVLVQLTTGAMETLLSYDRDQAEADARYPNSFAQLINLNRIVYINFESLADSVVGSALGSLFVADLTACAADRHHKGVTEPPVAIFIDEAAEMMNDPFIQALNKGRAAGFELTLASQTIADFVARMGNEAKALQVLGNVNTTIAMRLQDNESIAMVTEKFAETNYEEQSSSKSATTISAMKHGRDFSGSVMKGTQAAELSLVTADLLASLPPGHFFGHLPGGRKVKGRVLMMPLADEDRYDPQTQGQTTQRYELRGSQRKPGDGASVSERVESLCLDPDPKRSHRSAATQLRLPRSACRIRA